MLKSMKISKIMLCIVSILLMIILLGNTYVFADDSNTVTITATTATNNTTTETTNNIVNANSIVNSITATSNSSNYNNTTNNTTNKTTNNTTANKTNLPYTGSKSVSAFVVIILIGSAFYAYKKVSDYNL